MKIIKQSFKRRVKTYIYLIFYLSLLSTSLANASNPYPSMVEIISSSSVDPHSITLDWLPATDEQTKPASLIYGIHISDQAEFQPDATNLKLTLTNKLSAIIAQLNPNQTYYFIVTATDEDGYTSWSIPFRGETAKLAVKRTGNPIHRLNSQTSFRSRTTTSVFLRASEPTKPQLGELIVSDQEQGYLRRVTQAQPAINIGGQEKLLELQTTPATLNEVFYDLSFNTQIRLPSYLPQTSMLQRSGTDDQIKWDSGLTLQSPRIETTKLISINNTVQVVKGLYTDIVAPAYVAVQPTINNSISLSQITAPRNKGTQNILICHANVSFTHPSNSALNSILPKPNIQVTLTTPQELSSIKLTWMPLASQIDYQGRPYIATVMAYTDIVGGKCDGKTTGEMIAAKIPVYVTQGTPNLAKKTQLLTFKNSTNTFQINNTITSEASSIFSIAATINNNILTNAQVLAKSTMSFTNQLAIKALQTANLNQEINLLPEQRFTRIFMAGNVPVLVSGKFKINAKLTGEASGKIDLTELHKIAFSTDFGLKYENGQWKPITSLQPTYTFSLSGEADAKANITLSLIPDLQIAFYDTATSRMLVEPYLYAKTDLQGHFKYLDSSGKPIPLTDLDYWFNNLEAGFGTRFHLYAGLSMFGINLVSYPLGSNINDVSKFHTIDALKAISIYKLPELSSSIQTATNNLDSRAIRIRGTAKSYTLNLLGITLNLNPFTTWTTPKVITSDALASTYSIKPLNTALTSSLLDYDFIYTKPGTYKIRLGAYSRLGWFVRQVTEQSLDLSDKDLDGMPEFWEKKYNLTNASLDADSDGVNNLDEFKNGTSPLKADTDSDGFTDKEEITKKTNPIDKNISPTYPIPYPTDLKFTFNKNQMTLTWKPVRGDTTYWVEARTITNSLVVMRLVDTPELTLYLYGRQQSSNEKYVFTISAANKDGWSYPNNFTVYIPYKLGQLTN